MNDDEAVLQFLAHLQRDNFVIENFVLRHQAPPAHSKFRIAFLGQSALDQFDSRPDTAGILPAAAGAANPFAQNGPRQNQTAFVFFECPFERLRLPCRAHANRNERREQIGRYREARSFGDIIDAADQFQPATRANDSREQVGQVLPGAFDARRHDAGRDDGGFEQAEIILREIENFVEVRDVNGRAEVYARQAQEWFVNHAQVRFHGWFRRGVTAFHAQVHGDVQHLRALGKIHSQKENVAPGAVR